METIFETYMLPSGGKIYGKDKDGKDKVANPVVELTSMKVWQEMKKLSPTDMPYKLMSDIIEECMKTKLGISVYDLCLGDYQYLLYKLRTVTYGSQYKMTMICPECGKIAETIVDLDDILVNECPDDYANYTHIELPGGDILDITYQTPRKLDEVNRKAKNMAEKLKVNTDFSLLFTLMSVIQKVNGQTFSEIQLEEYCKNLGMKDANFIIRSLDVLNEKIGMSSKILTKCNSCKKEVLIPFRLTNEFLEPTL